MVAESPANLVARLKYKITDKNNYKYNNLLVMYNVIQIGFKAKRQKDQFNRVIFPIIYISNIKAPKYIKQILIDIKGYT